MRPEEPGADRHLGEAERGQQPEIGRCQPLAGQQRWLAPGQVFASQPAMLALLLPGWHRQAVAVDLHDLLDHDGVEARRHSGAGGDADRFAGAGSTVEGPPGECGAGDPGVVGASGMRSAARTA